MTVHPFSVRHRASDLASASEGAVDVLVVGAGATGAGVALDAASRGLSVVLVDKGDLASGTSSKSSKLIHGGLRYLENFELGLVYESVAERELLSELAPHLVHPMDFIYPLFADTAKGRLVRIGLTTYDVLAGYRNTRRHERITAEEAIAKAPALADSGLLRAYVYGDCATDDARLVLANIIAARSFGAVVLTYLEATSLLESAGRVVGAVLEDGIDGGTYEVRAKHVVNATGVWVDRLLGAADASHRPMVQPSKGVHLVVPRECVPLLSTSVTMPSRQGDGRSMFAIPWGRQTVLGTTDTAYDGSLDAVGVEQADVDYVLAAAGAVFDLELTEDDVVGAWAGCRPLLRGKGDTTADMSRRHTLIESETGLITITGGKLTTYRRMAKDVVDLVVDRDNRRARCRTDEIALGSSQPYDRLVAETQEAARSVGLDDELATLLVRQHGEMAPRVLSLAAEDEALAQPISPAAAHVLAEVVQAVRHEGAATLDDVFARRMRLSLRAKDAALPMAATAARLMAAELGRDETWVAKQVEAYAGLVRRERGVLGLEAAPVVG